MMSGSLRKLNKYWKNVSILKNGRRRTWQCFSIAASSYVPPSSTSNTLLDLKINTCWRDTRVLHTAQPLFSGIKTVQVPPFAESVTEGDLRWVKAVGDQVKEDETVAEVETDKTTVPVNAPFSGVIIELLIEDGSTVSPGTPIFKIQPKDVGDLSSLEKRTVPDAAPVAAPTASTTESAVPKQTLPPSAPATTAPIPSPPPSAEPSKGQLLQSIPVAAIKHSSFIHQAEVKMPPIDYTKEITGTRTEQRVKMSRMRLRIAQRLKDAQTSNAMLTTFNEIDMGNIMEMRKSIGDAFQKKHGIKLGFMSAFIKACAYSLQELPVVNAVIESQEIIYRDYVDISVAVATPKGLVVPVIRNAESMNYADIERSLVALGEKAKSGALAVEDMDGGTFTISNGGVFGSLFGTPIINPPQSAILGMHGIFDRPVARNGQVVIRPMMFVALTYDHRLIDGREAVTFLRKIKTTVEDPRAMLCGL